MPLPTPLLRRVLLMVAVLSIGIGATACQPRRAPSSTGGTSTHDVNHALGVINNYRAANGFGPLALAADATAKAQQHADDMAGQGRIFHSGSLSDGISDGWTALGENVGVAGSFDQVEGMFQNSSSHNANLLSGSYNQVGIGLAFGGDGQLYVTQDFVGR